MNANKLPFMKSILVALAVSSLLASANAQQIVKELLPTPPKGDKLEARLVKATIEPGVIGNWHSYPNHSVVYVIEGTLTLEFRSGESKVYKAAEGFVEPINTVLRGVNKGETAVKLAIFQVSPPDVPSAVDVPGL